MQTIEQANTVTNSLSVQALTLLELLEGASTHADKGKSALTALNSVQLLGGAGSLIARATDRFRLIEGKIEGEGHLDHTLISLDDVKRIIALAKEDNKVYGRALGLISLNRIGDLLTVSAGGNTITLNVLDANYPNSFSDLLNKSERESLGEIAFNPSLFADYAKIAGKGNAVRVEFTGTGKPIIIHLPVTKVEWRALLMPMRII
jgi:DNA polymerase III sliding clamp (beta) subunit (PCNA family)